MNQFIFSPTPIGPQKSDLAGELLDALDHVFLSIVKIELDSEEAVLFLLGEVLRNFIFFSAKFSL